VPNMGYL